MAPAVLFLDTTTLGLAFGVFIGLLNYWNTERFRRATGRNPWGVPPAVWGIASVFLSLPVTILALIALTTSRSAGVSRGGSLAERRARPPFGGQVPTSPMTRMPGDAVDPGDRAHPATLVADPAPTAPPSWQTDPSGKFDFRYWGGDEWTEFVSKDGEQSIDPF
jgi:hypothetical protein